jgi:hypothetical protein
MAADTKRPNLQTSSTRRHSLHRKVSPPSTHLFVFSCWISLP